MFKHILNNNLIVRSRFHQSFISKPLLNTPLSTNLFSKPLLTNVFPRCLSTCPKFKNKFLKEHQKEPLIKQQKEQHPLISEYQYKRLVIFSTCSYISILTISPFMAPICIGLLPFIFPLKR